MSDQTPPILKQGAGHFTWNDVANGTDIRVYYYLPNAPARLPSNTPVVFAMHGVGRDARVSRDAWSPIYETNNFFIVLAPRFDTKQYPYAVGYNLGNMFTLPDLMRVNPRSKWGFTAIEGIFDAVKSSLGIDATRYYLYGHSAGAQFVHRMVFFMPEARIEKAVAAEAGSYLFPNHSAEYPCGLDKTYGDPLPPVDLKKAFRTPMTVLLGGADTRSLSTDHDSYPCAADQGCNRLERGLNFFSAARAAAARYELHWKLEIVKCATHSDKDVVPCAARELFSELIDVVCNKITVYP